MESTFYPVPIEFFLLAIGLPYVVALIAIFAILGAIVLELIIENKGR